MLDKALFFINTIIATIYIVGIVVFIISMILGKGLVYDNSYICLNTSIESESNNFYTPDIMPHPNPPWDQPGGGGDPVLA